MRHKVIVATFLLMLMAAGTAGANSASEPLTERERAAHALSRLAFGPRPGEVERVMEIGVDRWIERQLHPEVIDDDLVDEKLEALETLRMSSDELFEKYQQPILEARAEMRREAAGDEGGDRSVTTDRMRARRGEDDPRRPVAELTMARLTRATLSERQLDEVMVEFWMNHFNVFAGKQPVGVLLTEFEYGAIRPHIWGSFEELLLATARSPAMLVYLDNVRSVAEIENRSASERSRSAFRPRRSGMRSAPGRGGPSRGRQETRMERRLLQAGLNENYARELMELHTLGVDGGYDQDDVVALARILTGWSIERPGEGTKFVFRSELHDVGKKEFLGATFPRGGGIDEGERAIRMLARHPSTARTIATKLVQYLVADEPPSALVDRVATRFSASGGDLRATVREIVTSSEFFDRAHFRSKTRTPFELVVSSLRATGADAEPRFLALQLRELGQPLYFCQSPTGYSDLAEDWISSAQLMTRINFATALASGRVAEIELPSGDLQAIAGQMIGIPPSESMKDVIEPGQSQREKIALILGSPDFQKQ